MVRKKAHRASKTAGRRNMQVAGLARGLKGLIWQRGSVRDCAHFRLLRRFA